MIPVFFAVLLLAGCPFKKPVSTSYEISPHKPEGRSISRTVMLLADNQLNHLYGDPMWMRSAMIDQLVSVAVRPIQQDLFAPDLLRWVMKNYGAVWPVIHLGDATNMACVGELEAFFQVMAAGREPWVMAPGNHDCFLFGNSQVNGTEWAAACQRARGPTTKDRFIRLYLRQLARQFPEFREQLSGNIPDSGSWTATWGTGSLLRAVAWQIDTESPWRSFIVQLLDLTLTGQQPPTYAILMDSIQYGAAPTLLPASNAGTNGDMQENQLDTIEGWLADGKTAGGMTILMSHHPFGVLKKGVQQRIDRFRKRYDIPLFVSGHTHHGQFYVLGGNSGWLELNVGSITDWPIEFRTLTLADSRDDADKLVLISRQFRIPDIFADLTARAPVCRPAWEARPEESDYYLKHAMNSTAGAEETQRVLMDSLLATWTRLLENVPSAADNPVWPPGCETDAEVLAKIADVRAGSDLAEKIDLLMALDRFDHYRSPADRVVRRDYRICQAIWASKYEKQGGNWPIPSDPYIVFPKGR
jgi:hypothetical protein